MLGTQWRDKHDTHERSRHSSTKSTQRSSSHDSIPASSENSTSREVKPSRRSKASLNKSTNIPEQPVVYAIDHSDEDEPIAEGASNLLTIAFDSDDDLDYKYKVASRPAAEIKDPTPDIEEVEEFPELVAAARARAAAIEGNSIEARLQARLAQLRESHSAAGSGGGAAKSASSVPAPRDNFADDPVIQILVSARIDGTKPLLVQRRLSQRLKDVRQVWCDKQVIEGQPMDEETKKSFFLTWRGHRLFDSSTGRALGLKVNAHGSLSTSGDGFDDGRVHLEAWTEDLFKAHQKELEDMRRKVAQDPLEEDDVIPEAPVVEVQKIRLILKAKDYEEVKVLVKMETVVAQLIDRFRKQRKIAEDKTIKMMFDGDELEPELTVQEADMDDMTKVDVYVN